MKTLHLISSNGLYGAERVVLNLTGDERVEAYVGAIKNQHNPHLEIIDEAKRAGFKTAVFESGGRFDLRTISLITKFIRDNKIEILHTHNYKSDMIGLLAAKKAGIPIVATAHGFTDVDRKVSFYEKLDRFILKNFFNAVIVVTQEVYRGLPRKMVIPNGIDIEKYAIDRSKGLEFRHKWGINESDIVIGTVGRLSKEKNQILLLQAAKEIVKHHSNIKFVIVGNGPEEQALKKFVQDQALSRCVIFTGQLSDLPAVYQGMDIFVLPSLTEGVPLTVLEAMASKRVVIASSVGGIPNIIEHGQTGFLFSSADQGAFLSLIDSLIEDVPLKVRIEAQAFKFVSQHYSQARMREEYLKLYGEVLNARPSGDNRTK